MTKPSIAFPEGPGGATGDKWRSGRVGLEPHVIEESFAEGGIGPLDRGLASGGG